MQRFNKKYKQKLFLSYNDYLNIRPQREVVLRKESGKGDKVSLLTYKNTENIIKDIKQPISNIENVKIRSIAQGQGNIC